MDLSRLRAVFMRGGTSKALMFRAQDLPPAREDWAPIFLAAMGSPDPHGRQLDGMGGGLSSLSKVCVVGPSTRADADLDYTFAQVLIDTPRVEYRGNCGNMLAAVGPFAVDEGLIAVPGDGEARVRIFNVNTGKHIVARFPVREGRAETLGELAIPGVAGRGAPIRLDFLDPGGATTGRLLPTGAVAQALHVPPFGDFEVSMVDAGNACVCLAASAVGLTGNETPQAIERDAPLMATLEAIRRAASIAMGFAADEAAAAASLAIPYLALISPPADFTALDGSTHGAASHHFSARVLASGQPHRALPLTVSLCLAVAARIEGSVVQRLARPDASETLKLAMPSGVLEVAAVVERVQGGWVARSGAFYRTARRLFEGAVVY